MKAIHEFLYKDRYFKFETETVNVEVEYDLYCILGIVTIIAVIVWMF